MDQKFEVECEASPLYAESHFSGSGQNSQGGSTLAGDPPLAAANFIRRSAASMRCRGENVSRARSERLALNEWTRLRNARLKDQFLDSFRAVAEGAEHVVFHDSENARAVKVTHPNRFGHSIRFEGAISTVSEYLSRLVYQNEFFGDDIRILGTLMRDDTIEIVTSQPWIVVDLERPTPTEGEIDDYFAERSFQRIELTPGIPLYYCSDFGLLLGDANNKNVLRDSRGRLIPIDVVIGTPDQSLLEKLMDAGAVILDHPHPAFFTRVGLFV